MSDPSNTSRRASGPSPERAASSTAERKAHASASAPPRIRRRNRLITSCLECRRRKLKCDKQNPCTNCTKFGRDCLFLAPALDPAAQLRLAEMKEKIGSLERSLEEDVARRPSVSKSKPSINLPGLEDADSADEDDPEDERDLEPTPMAIADTAYSQEADDDIMDLGIALGKMRITEKLGATFTQLNEILKVVPGAPPSDSGFSSLAASPKSAHSLAPGPDYIPPASSFLFAPEPRRDTLLHFLPSKAAADKLIARYFEAVHPVTRIVHRPSFERQYSLFWQNIGVSIEPPFSFQAAVLAALLSAVISLPDDSILSEYGASKPELVENFRQGAETALARANFLRTTKLETLQAFVMYMIPLCRKEVSRAHSALLASAIRLAECMSLNRDGSHYGLSPVETHVRRLVWYQLCVLDIRVCQAVGPRPIIRREDFDTKFPLNVDDFELESPNPPTNDADRWTDMTLTRMRFECTEMQRLIWIERPRVERKKTTLTALLSKIQNFWAAMEKRYFPMLDKRIPIHYFAYCMYIVASRGMHIGVLSRYITNAQRMMPERLRQLTMSSGTVQLEHAITLETNPSLATWAWYSGALQQYHTALLLMGELYVSRPNPREEERIWRCLDYVFELPPEMTTLEKVRYVLIELRDRASVLQSVRKTRAPTTMRDPGPVSYVSEYSQNAKQGVGAQRMAYFRGHPSVNNAGPNFDFNSIADGVHGEALATPAQQVGPGSAIGASVPGGAGTMGHSESPHDLMTDIDWNEWDKIFPQDFNSGDFNIPDFSFPPGGGSMMW
ncbi:hypothetical protein H2199_002012 [Coniosporium tulheliwenetii]|uniref:Uncharacterized protein n=1 Tax=Coniosporium tulheliwenetii TaxID=3383036 RepID=A0ACC2ZGS4_9PEZI|nr:hypothetical protein H2199_002012 [Cladosporium sp. JES 115]